MFLKTLRAVIAPTCILAMTFGSPMFSNAPDTATAQEQYILADDREVGPLDMFQDCAECPEMIVLPMGSFVMGAPLEESAYLYLLWKKPEPGVPNGMQDEGPEHDTIIYESGDDTIAGNKSNYGTDTLDLSKYTADQVSFSISETAVVVTPPDGSVTLNNQLSYDLGHDRSNIEQIVFSDGTLDETGIRDRALSDQATTGDDAVSGTTYADIINAGAGNDMISGLGGTDTFEFNTGDGQDVITDFADGVELINFLETGLTFADLTVTDDANGDAVINYGGTDTVTLDGVTAAQIAADDFIFA